jgi:cyclophilin family peptidyl-prolyl cis-trans isomerase
MDIRRDRRVIVCKLVAAALAAFVAAHAAAQEASPGVPPPAGTRAELRAMKPLYSPDATVALRFTLVNEGSEPITIPLAQPPFSEAGVSLPVELVLGPQAQPWLWISYEGEDAVAVEPPAEEVEPAARPYELRLAAHGAVGLELNLRSYFKKVRYSGVYRVEWRPFGGQLGPVEATFRVEPRKDVIMVTDYGKMTFVMQYDRAPLNVDNFLDLVRTGFYDGSKFHRVVPGMIIQGGCPRGDGTGIRPDGKLVRAEFHPDIPVEAGTLLMARKPSDPNSASCQFFIALSRLPMLDGEYTVIGQAQDDESLRTLEKLAAVPLDRGNRPREALVIRSMNLASTEGTRTIQLQFEGESKSRTRKQTEPELPPEAGALKQPQ